MGPGGKFFPAVAHSTPSCTTLLYWSLGSIDLHVGVHICVCVCVYVCPIFIRLIKVSSSLICHQELSVSKLDWHTHYIIIYVSKWYWRFSPANPPLVFIPLVCFFFLLFCVFIDSVFLSPRDFAYVARDKNTRILKCHVFRCDTPAKAIATSLHEICSRVSGSSLRRFQRNDAKFGFGK